MPFFIFLFFAISCAHKVPSMRLLEARSGYNTDNPLKVDFIPAQTKQIPHRTAPVMADIWIHPHEMATGEYFLGGWVRTVIKEPHWSIGDGLGQVFKPNTSIPKERKQPSKSKPSSRFRR